MRDQITGNLKEKRPRPLISWLGNMFFFLLNPWIAQYTLPPYPHLPSAKRKATKCNSAISSDGTVKIASTSSYNSCLHFLFPFFEGRL